jgi:AcrR family transcriptional regulator
MEVRKVASDATRARIVEAARGLLRRPEGIAGFSMEAVAKAAGVSRMTVYHQFDSKAGLFEALSDDLAARGQLGARMGAAMSRPDPLEALDGLLAAFAAFWDDDRVVMARLRALGVLDAEIAEPLRGRNARRANAAMAVVSRLRAAELIPDAIPDAEAVALLVTLSSFETFETLAGPDESLMAALPVVQRTARAALGVPAAP